MILQHQNLINTLRKRKKSGGAFGTGIGTADKYVRDMVECVGTGLCQQYLGGKSVDGLLKEAGSKLTYAGDQLTIDGKAAGTQGIREILPEGVQPPPNTLMVIRHVLTTPKEDRDRDTLQTAGAHVDSTLPFLWQHIHTLPIGKAIMVLEHTPQVLRMATALLDLKSDLTDDAAILFEADVLRFSHGFNANKYVERKEPGGGVIGFNVLDFDILEESGVSIPSNTDAEPELWSRQKLKSDFWKAHAKSAFDRRIKSSPGFTLSSPAATGQMHFKSFGDLSAAIQGAAAVSQEPEPKTPCRCHGKASKPAGAKGEQLDLFEIREDAEARAEALGCEGCHEVNGKFRPCGDAAEYERMAAKIAEADDSKELNDGSGDAGLDLYENRVDAEQRAEALGCEGAHQVGDKWAPCGTAEEFTQFQNPKAGQPAGTKAKPANKAGKPSGRKQYIDTASLVSSYGWRWQKLYEKLTAYLAANAVVVGRDDYVYIAAMFDGYALITLCERGGDEDWYRANWSERDGDCFWDGQPEEVDVNVSVAINPATRSAAAAYAKAYLGAKFRPELHGESQPEKPAGAVAGAKAGRVLSAANAKALQSAIADLGEIAGDDVPRWVTAITDRVAGTIQGILDSASPEDDGMQETSARTLNAKAAAMLLLSKGDTALLEKTAEAIDGVLRVHRSDEKGKRLRRLLA